VLLIDRALRLAKLPYERHYVDMMKLEQLDPIGQLPVRDLAMTTSPMDTSGRSPAAETSRRVEPAKKRSGPGAACWPARWRRR
jgi:hypothetical protein